ncbi:eukaryotic translation initiation factor 3 subunit M-like protein [Tanacetum coccineum]|uniref:Eukaryotic translation initiation factor 3 subunit M-like protein n=1 Tax=Tanacetum coccineum TaxID=301880 RepID=A0ABQ5GV54_9ASTR
MSLVDLAFDDSTQIPYSAVKDTLQIEDDEVESWLVKEITAKLVDCKIDQMNQVVIVSRCTNRVFGPSHWLALRTKLTNWRGNIANVITTIQADKVTKEGTQLMHGDCSFEEGSVYLKVRSARKPKLCPFRLSTDEKTLMWFSGKDGKHLHLSSVRSIIRGHQTLSVYQDNAIVALKRELIFYSTVREGTLNSARSGYPQYVSEEKIACLYEKHLHLRSVTSIIRRHQVRKVQPERESHSFSLIYMTNQAQCSLDLICKNKVQADSWTNSGRQKKNSHLGVKSSWIGEFSSGLEKEKVERDREREREREKDKSKHKEKKNEDVADGRRDEEKIQV